MALSSRLLRVPKPQHFLYFTSLSTGASLITLSLIVNKLTGVYGILALVTGFELSPFQLSMYIYSIIALGLTVYLSPHIKTQTPVFCLALAWFYVFDSIINAMYTAAFGATWFLILLQHGNGEKLTKGPGAGTIGDTAGFTDPKQNVSRVEVIATPQTGDFSPKAGQEAIAGALPAEAAAGVGDGSSLVWGRESINSVGVIVSLWTIRAYFCVVMLAWARMVLRSHIAAMQARNPTTDFTKTSPDGTVENPFDADKPDGQGWKGKLGRLFVNMGKRYWLGTDEDQSWLNAARGKFVARQGSVASSNTTEAVPLAKINKERESRRRSGTGPPLPEVQAAAAVSHQSEAEEVRKISPLTNTAS